MCREALLEQIDQASFAVDDVKLYLNTHPDDQEALRFYEQHRDARLNLLQQYAQQFGPLTADLVYNTQCWTWPQTPWPWEKEA